MFRRFRKNLDKFDFVVFILYKLLLDYIYLHIHGTLYAYYGFSLVPNDTKMAIGWVMFVIASIFIASKDKSITTTFTYTIFLLSVVPCIVYYEYNPEATLPMVLSQTIAIVVMEILFRITRPKEDKPITYRSPISYKNKTLRALAFVGLVGFFAVLLIQNGIPSLSSISLTNISQVRAENSQSTFMALLENLVCKIVCPIFIFVSLKEKKWIPFIFAVLVQVYSYSVTGFKTYLFIPVVIIAVNLIRGLNLKKCIVIGLPLAVIGATLIYTAFDEIMPYALIVERVVFLPAKIKVAYFDYFSTHELLWFKESTIAHFLGFESPYSTAVPYIIGDVYFGRPNMWTNTGFMADAYSNAGYFGIVLMCLVVFIVLVITRKHLRNVPPSLSRGLQAVFLLFFISLNDGGAISVIFSGGMIFMIILIALVDFSGINIKVVKAKKVKVQHQAPQQVETANERVVVDGK